MECFPLLLSGDLLCRMQATIIVPYIAFQIQLEAFSEDIRYTVFYIYRERAGNYSTEVRFKALI